jgi:hypothetical protein
VIDFGFLDTGWTFAAICGAVVLLVFASLFVVVVLMARKNKSLRADQQSF